MNDLSPHPVTEQPLVSVIIPAYNRPRYLEEAMRSVLEQTYRNVELIVSDNSCVQDSRAVVESFNDPRVRYLRVASNFGMTDNNLVGFRAARGKYFANLHDDDTWESDLLDKLVPPLEADPDLVISFCDHHVMNMDGRIMPENTEASTRYFQRDKLHPGVHRPFSYMALVPVSVPMTMCTVIRRAAIDLETDFPKMTSCYDFWLAYLACREGGGAYYLPERLMSYRWHAGNDTGSGRIRIAESLIVCFSEFLKDDRVRDLHDEFKRLLANSHANLARGLLRAGRPAEARPHLWEATRRVFQVRYAFLAMLISILPDAILRVRFLREALPAAKTWIRGLKKSFTRTVRPA